MIAAAKDFGDESKPKRMRGPNKVKKVNPEIAVGMIFKRNDCKPGQDERIIVSHVDHKNSRAYYVTSKGRQFDLDSRRGWHFDGKMDRKNGFTYLAKLL